VPDQTPVQRSLAAILAADVVGFSKLVGEDEAGTLAALQEIRKEIVNPVLAEHAGRVFKLMGDGFVGRVSERGPGAARCEKWEAKA
jgi:adenylate cyclase